MNPFDILAWTASIALSALIAVIAVVGIVAAIRSQFETARNEKAIKTAIKHVYPKKVN
jgi:hypothetical protein